MVRYALNNGKGIKKNEVIFLSGAEQSKPLLFAIYAEIIDAGGHVILDYRPDDINYNFEEYFYNNGNNKQVSFFPENM